LLNSNTSPARPDNMVNLGLLMAEICWRVWGTHANFNGFRVLACSVTARHSSSGREPNFAALNRGRHLYSAGRPSGWALTHISILSYKTVYSCEIVNCHPHLRLYDIAFQNFAITETTLKVIQGHRIWGCSTAMKKPCLSCIVYEKMPLFRMPSCQHRR